MFFGQLYSVSIPVFDKKFAFIPTVYVLPGVKLEILKS